VLTTEKRLAQLDNPNIRRTVAFGLLWIAFLALGCASSGPKIIQGKDYNSKFDFYFSALGDTIRHGPLTGYFTEVDGADAEDAGKIHWTATYVDGNLHGPYKSFFPSGKLEYDRYFVGDLEHGTRTRYRESGEVRSESNYVAGKLEGESRSYFEDGTESFTTWSSGIKEGLFKASYKDGASASGSNSQGEWNGVIHFVYESGDTEKATYSYGVKHGPALYTAIDKSSAEMHFVDDKAHGLLSSFDVEGDLSFVKGYWKGENVFYLDCSEPSAFDTCSNLLRTDQLIMTLRYKSHILFGDMFGVKFHIDQRQVGFLGADIVYVEEMDSSLKDILTEEYETRRFRFVFLPSDKPAETPHLGILHTWDEDDGMKPVVTDFRLHKIELVDEEGVYIETIASTRDIE